MSLSLNKLENDLWLRLVELKCQKEFSSTKFVQINEDYLLTLNEQFQRRVRLIEDIFIYINN